MAKRSETPGKASVPPPETYAAWMGQALELAAATAGAQDVPVGALVVAPDGGVVGRGHNVREELGDPTGHAEVVALREAAGVGGSWRLDGCTLVVTLEPCVMCAGAAMAARVERVVFGAWDPKAGACGSVWDLTRDPLATHVVDVVGGVLAEESAALLVDFFEGRRLR
ncbi:nucleoside deaminase [Terrabacter aerolatus]|nr:nucleoside deaminase [Terrabacter aerolatus]